MSDQITMRVWTNMGKEHIYPVDYFRTHSSTLEIGSDVMDSILCVVDTGAPCTISFLTCTSEDEVGRYSEHNYRGCTVVKGSIRYLALCVPA